MSKENNDTLNKNPFVKEKKKEVIIGEISKSAKVLAEESKKLFNFIEQKEETKATS